MKNYHNVFIHRAFKVIILLVFMMFTVSSNPRAISFTAVSKNQNLEKMISLDLINSNKKNYLPVCSNSSTKTYMDYNKITNKESEQYKYIKKNMFVNEEGFLVDKDDYIGAALGSYFGKIGTKYIFTLDTGIKLKIIKIETKSDSHVINGCQHKSDGSVIEFVIDVSKFTKSKNGYVYNGNFNNNKKFKGKIESIEIQK